MSGDSHGEAGLRRIAVLGLGNVLQRDDALGPYVAELLSCTFDFPPGVTVLDAGTPGLDLTPYIGDWWMCLPIVFGTFLGAIGFPVLLNVSSTWRSPRRWTRR